MISIGFSYQPELAEWYWTLKNHIGYIYFKAKDINKFAHNLGHQMIRYAIAQAKHTMMGKLGCW
jgi:hypothetical protein